VVKKKANKNISRGKKNRLCLVVIKIEVILSRFKVLKFQSIEVIFMNIQRYEEEAWKKNIFFTIKSIFIVCVCSQNNENFSVSLNINFPGF